MIGYTLSYALDTALLLLFALADTIPTWIAISYGAAGMVLCGVFYCLLIIGFSERFRDPHLALYQVAASGTVMLVFLALAPEVGFVFLSIIFIVFGFGSLRMSGREIAIAWGAVVLVSGAILSRTQDTPWLPQPGPIEYILVWIWFVLTSARLIALGLFGSSLQRQLSQRNRQLTEAISAVNARALELVVAKEHAEAANREKLQFLSNMSHEIRTPLNGILGMAELLQDSPLSAKQQRHCQAITSSGRGLYDLLSGILDLSKIDSGLIQIEAVDFDLAHLLNELSATFSEIASERGNTLIAEFELQSLSLLRGDPMRLRQVLSNIIGNAVKFTQAGNISLAVSVLALRAEDPRTWLRFSIRDSGIGIAPEKLASLCKPFVQADSSITRRFGGAGLGLALSKQFVTLMGGSIHLESTPGVGTHIWFDLPFAVAQHAEAAPAIDAPIVQRLAARVLLAEDNEVNQEVIAAMLGHAGAEVQVVENGALAVQALRHGEFDVVLMDCQMPVMSGYEATSAIRADEAPGRRIPIIALTAGAFAEDREHCFAVGMDDYLAKPVQRAALVQTVARWAARPAGPGEAVGAPAAHAADPEPVGEALDQRALDQIRALEEPGSNAVLQRVIGIFLTSTPGRVRALRSAADAGDPVGLAKAAHALKSSTISIGATRLGTQCHDIEAAARSNPPDISLARVATLESEYSRVEQLLRAELEVGAQMDRR